MTQKKQRTQFDIMHPLFKAFEDSDLSTTQRMILLGLFKYMDGEGVCYPSYKALEKTTGATASTITRNLKQLVSSGWITYKQGDKTKSLSNEYHLNLVRLGIETKPEQKKVVALDRRYLAEDGNYYDSPAEYFRVKHDM